MSKIRTVVFVLDIFLLVNVEVSLPLSVGFLVVQFFIFVDLRGLFQRDGGGGCRILRQQSLWTLATLERAEGDCGRVVGDGRRGE